LNDDATVKTYKIDGIYNGQPVLGGPLREGEINIRASIFDDPFIFPRFFRTNVIGIVVSIPLDRFPAGQRNYVLWATASKNGKLIDHVGRSQRTQLPRFDHLNTLPPSQHVADLNRRHENPGLLDDFMRTFLSPLFGRRPYDAAPDVIVFTRDRETKFPNGRKLDDDVAALIAQTGDTQLWEAAYMEDNRYPRVTKNDGEFKIDEKTKKRVRNPDGSFEEYSLKPFSTDFPYLAGPWTVDQRAAAPPFQNPGRPNFTNRTWRTLWLVEMGAILALMIGLWVNVRSKVGRIGVAIIGLLAIWLLCAVYAENLSGMQLMDQPYTKLKHLAAGAGIIVVLFPAFFYVLGRRRGASAAQKEQKEAIMFPKGEQGVTVDDRQPPAATFEAVRDAVFAEPYYDQPWGTPGGKPLPVYEQSFRTLVRGLLRGSRFPLVQAARRTVKSHADLRWGQDGKGFRRLLHPNGICLSGSWEITTAPPGVEYTGYFAKGSVGRVIARYSTGGSEPRGGNFRSLAMVGKLYPERGPGGPVHFIVQEDIAGNYTTSIREAKLTNSTPVTPWKSRDPLGLFLIGVTLLFADKKNTERQLYEIAELEKPADQKTKCPRFMRLTVAGNPPALGGEGVDFRDEILGILYNRGDDKPSGRHLVFDIEVSDEGEHRGFLLEWVEGQIWTKIGTLTVTEAVASYNGDFVIHFRHPPWRNDRNDPTSVAHSELKSV
jgi:hypothetical protein